MINSSNTGKLCRWDSNVRGWARAICAAFFNGANSRGEVTKISLRMAGSMLTDGLARAMPDEKSSSKGYACCHLSGREIEIYEKYILGIVYIAEKVRTI